MKLCEACGKPHNGNLYIGNAKLCESCIDDVEREVKKLRDAGKPVNSVQVARTIFRESYCSGNYLLRDIPQDLWKRAWHRVVDDDSCIRELIILALEKYLKE